MKRYLYVMLSRSNTGMGRLIRFVTKGEYNHVSLCVNDELQQFVSFARYRQDTPLAGGYVSEPPMRLLSGGKTLPVRIFRLDISPDDAQQLEALFELADHSALVYNSLGALLSSCHISFPIPGSYTCLEFAGRILGRTFPSIQALENTLEPWEVYRGDLSDILASTNGQNCTFFHKRGFWKGTWDTALHFKTLLWRILHLEKPQDPISECSLNILTKNIPQSSI